MLSSRLFNIISSSVVFIFVFSIYNDNFTVDYLGANSLKAIFLVFILFNIYRITRNLMDRDLIKDLIPFLVYFLLTFFVMLMNPPTGEEQGAKLFENIMLLASMLFIILFFINYDLMKTLYFIWGALIVSAIVAFFNSPISRWTFRKTGGTGDPNEFASQMVSLLFISIFLFRKNKNIYFIIISVIAIGYSILYAGSMSSFIVLFLLGVFLLIRFLSLSFVKSLIITSVVTVSLITGMIIFQEQIESVEVINNLLGRTEETGTAYTRFHSWSAGLRMVADHPLLGVGMRQYGAYSPKYSTVFLAEDSVAPHNILIEIISETGVLVFFAFLLFLFNLLSKYFGTIVHSDYFWLYLAVVAYLLMGLTIGITYNKFFWLTIAVLMRVHSELTFAREHVLDSEFAYTELKVLH